MCPVFSMLCEVCSCFKCSTFFPIPKKQKVIRLKSVIWKPGAGTPEGPLLDPLKAVCLSGKRVCGCQHGTALHPATSLQTWDLWEDPVCGQQLSFQHDILPVILLTKLSQFSVATPSVSGASTWKFTSKPCTIKTTLVGLLTERRLQNWLSGAVITWIWTRSKQWTIVDFRRNTPSTPPTHHNEQYCGSGGAPSSLRTWNGTLTYAPLRKRPRQRLYCLHQLTKFCFWSSTLQSQNLSSVLL